MIDANILEALKWILTFGAGVMFVMLSYWGKTMADEIKEVKSKHEGVRSDIAEQDVIIATITTTLTGRDALQDERWKNLDSKMTMLHTDVQALVHSQISVKKGD